MLLLPANDLDIYAHIRVLVFPIHNLQADLDHLVRVDATIEALGRHLHLGRSRENIERVGFRPQWALHHYSRSVLQPPHPGTAVWCGRYVLDRQRMHSVRHIVLTKHRHKVQVKAVVHHPKRAADCFRSSSLPENLRELKDLGLAGSDREVGFCHQVCVRCNRRRRVYLPVGCLVQSGLQVYNLHGFYTLRGLGRLVAEKDGLETAFVSNL